MSKDNMNENNRLSSLPDRISSLTDDEAITEIDLGSFLVENSKSDTLFEGFRDDIERTEKSLEADLQSLYDDIIGSGPETIVPKPLSVLTEKEAEPQKVALSDPDPLPETNNSSLDDIWMNPDDYFENDIPVVSLDGGNGPKEETVFEPAPEKTEKIGTEDARAGIFSMIDMLKKETSNETGFSAILSEIESNPEIAPVDTELSAAARLVSNYSAPASASVKNSVGSEPDEFDWDGMFGDESAPAPVATEKAEDFSDDFFDIPVENISEPVSAPAVTEKADDFSDDFFGFDEETDKPSEPVSAPQNAEQTADFADFSDEVLELPDEFPDLSEDTIELPANLSGLSEPVPEIPVEEIPVTPVADTNSDDFDAELAALLGDTVPAKEDIPVSAEKKDFVINVPDDGNDYERAAAQPEKFYESQPMSTVTYIDEKEFLSKEFGLEDGKKGKKKNKKEKKSDEPAEKKKSTAGDIVRNIVLTISIITIIVCGGMLANVYIIEPYRFKADADKIATEMSDSINTHSDATVNDVQNTVSDADYPAGMLAKYATLYAANDDLRGWISIPGFEINLPIAQGKDNNYYLKKDIYGKYTRYGVPFFDYRMTDFNNLHRNTVIYGHNMRHDDLIFGMLENYRTPEGFRQAPVIECNTIYGDHTWFVYAVFITNSQKEDDNGYVFPYNFIDLGDGNFRRYLEEVDARKLYTTGVDIAITDKILTLSTCAYDFDDARLVVVARERREGESVAVDTSKVYKNNDPRFPQAWYDAYGKENTHANDPNW